MADKGYRLNYTQIAKANVILLEVIKQSKNTVIQNLTFYIIGIIPDFSDKYK